MRLHADVKCDPCARVWGAWTWETGRSRYISRGRASADERVFSAPIRIRCPRCGGPTFLEDDIEGPPRGASTPAARPPGGERSVARAS